MAMNRFISSVRIIENRRNTKYGNTPLL